MRHCVRLLDGDPAPPQKKRHSFRPIFGPCLLWPNGQMDQDAIWQVGRPRLKRYCVRWGPSSPPRKKLGHSPQFSAHVYCDQTAGCISLPLGMEVGLGSCDIVLDGDRALPKRGTGPQFLAHVYCGQTAGWIKMPLGIRRQASAQTTLRQMGTQLPLKGAEPPIFSPCLLWPNGWIDQDATWCGGRPRPRRHCVRWGPAPPTKGERPHRILGPCLLWPNDRPSQLLVSSCLKCVSVRDILQFSLKTVPGSWTRVAETTLSNLGSCSWQNIVRSDGDTETRDRINGRTCTFSTSTPRISII